MITDYASLRTEVASWLNREDLTDAIKSFVQFAEKKFIRDPRVRNSAGESITPLSDVATTNWLVTDHPDIYLYGALVESAPYLKDDPRVPVWEAQLERRLTELGSSRINTSRSLSLNSFAGLKGQIAEFLNRPDLAPVIPSFVRLAEDEFRRDPRVKHLTRNAALVVSADGVALPATLLSVESWRHDGGTYYGPIEIVNEDAISTLKSRHGTTGVPRYAAIVDGAAYFAPEPDDSYTTVLTYWERPARLAADGDTNWLLENHSDAYLYGALVASAPYLRDDARVALWESLKERALAGIQRAAWDEQYGGGSTRRHHRAIGG